MTTQAPLKAPTTSGRSLLERVGIVLLAFFGIIIGIGIWVIGARYTIDGILWGSNQALIWVKAPPIIPEADWRIYAALAPIPILCSLAEWAAPTIRQRQQNVPLVVIWLLLIVLDLASTFFGIGIPQEAVRLDYIWTGALTAFFTFFPEWLIWGCVRSIRR